MGSILLLLFSCSVVSDSLRPTRLLCLWDSPGKNTGVGCCALLQGIFLTQGSNPNLLHWQMDSLPSDSPGKPYLSFYDWLIWFYKTSWRFIHVVARGEIPFLNNSRMYVFTIFSLYIHWLMDIWVMSISYPAAYCKRLFRGRSDSAPDGQVNLWKEGPKDPLCSSLGLQLSWYLVSLKGCASQGQVRPVQSPRGPVGCWLRPPPLGCHMADTLPLLYAGSRLSGGQCWWFSLLLFYLLSQCSLQREHSPILEPSLWLAPKGLEGEGVWKQPWVIEGEGNDLSAQNNNCNNSNQHNNTTLNMGICNWVMCLACS